MKQDAKLAVLQGNGVSPNKKAMEKAVKTKSEKKRRHSVILSGSLKAMKIQARIHYFLKQKINFMQPTLMTTSI